MSALIVLPFRERNASAILIIPLIIIMTPIAFAKNNPRAHHEHLRLIREFSYSPEDNQETGMHDQVDVDAFPVNTPSRQWILIGWEDDFAVFED